MDPYLLAIAGGSSAVATAILLWGGHRLRIGSYRRLAADILHKADTEAKNLHQEAEFKRREAALEHQCCLEEKSRAEQAKWNREHLRLEQREDKLEDRRIRLDKRETSLERRQQVLTDAQVEIDGKRHALLCNEEKLTQELERIAGINQDEAKQELLERLKKDIKQDAAHLTRRLMREAEDEVEQRTQRLLANAINRLAVPCVSEATVSTVTLPNDEMKGRIIGREGRNIRAFEHATGVNIVIDDTPGAVVISGFDPVRRHIAKTALKELILDGRIHPTRIEEVVQRSKDSAEQEIRNYGEDAAVRAGASDLHPELMRLLGKLKFRYSFGQNVLEHSLEVSHLLGMMAGELGLDITFARRIGLLHDVGKSMTHEMEGTHALIGHDLVLKYGESPELANGVGCHHGEIAPITIEGSLCGAADAISASRPGARIEAVEEYVKRLRKLESIASEYPGVSSVYALQAGREIRIAVLPDMIDDDGCQNLARDISKRIEKVLSYPGAIKVTVIREKRAIHYAS